MPFGISSFFCHFFIPCLLNRQFALTLYTGMVNFLSGILFVILINLLSVTNNTHTANFSTVCDTIFTTLSEEIDSENDFETEVSEPASPYLHDYTDYQCNLNNNRRRCSRNNTSKQIRDGFSDEPDNIFCRPQTQSIKKLSSYDINCNNTKAFIRLKKLII